MHKVAITGVGGITCLGNGADAIAESLRKGRSGIVRDEEREKLGFRSSLTGVIRDFDAQALLPKKSRKTMTDFGVWTYVACLEALGMARLDRSELRSPRCGLIFGCDSSCLAAVEQTDVLRNQGDTGRIGSGLIFRAMNSTVTMNLSTLFGTQGRLLDYFLRLQQRRARHWPGRGPHRPGQAGPHPVRWNSGDNLAIPVQLRRPGRLFHKDGRPS